MPRNVYELGALSPSEVRIRVPDARMFTSDSPRGAVVEIHVDWNRIAKQLAARAVRSKRGRSQVMEGAVLVKVLERFVPGVPNG